MRHRAFALCCIAVIAAATGAWAGSPAGGSALAKRRPRALTAEFSSRTVDAVIQGLARAGIGVYEPGSEEPLVEPAAPVSPLRLSQSQARNAALGAWARSGLSGAELDELVPIPDAERTLVPPVSALVAAYVDVGKTPGARFARKVMGHQSWDDVHAVVFPPLVLDLFMSDVVTTAGGSTGSSPSTAQSVRLMAFRSPAAAPEQQSSGACSATQNFVNGVVQAVFAVIPKINPPDPSGVSRTFGSFFGSIINAALRIGASVVNGLVEGAQFAVVNGIKVLIQPVLNVVASIAGVVAVVAQVVTTLQPWTLVVRADPTNTRKAVGREKGLHGAFHLGVETAVLKGDWPADIADCARVAGVVLPPLKPQDAPVHWTLAGGPDLLQPRSPTDTTLSKNSTSDLEYETTSEPEANAKRGESRQGGVSATARVNRTELDQLQAALVNLLFSQIPAAIAPIVTPFLRSTLQPAINNALAGLTRLHDPAPSFATVIVAYHDPPKPKTGAGCGTAGGPASSGDWTIRPIVSCERIGLKIEKVGGLKVNATFALLVDHPHLQLHLSTKNGKQTLAGAELIGIKGMLLDFGAGAANPSDNTKFQLDVPLQIEVPVRGGADDDSASVKVTWTIQISTAFTGQNATLLARGRYGLNGPVGIRGGAAKTPTLSVQQSLIDSISGISLGPSGIVIAVKTQFAAGADVPTAAKGAFVALSASFGVTNGSSLGASLARCHGATLDLSFVQGHGKTAVSKTIVHREQTLPDVPLCHQ